MNDTQPDVENDIVWICIKCGHQVFCTLFILVNSTCIKICYIKNVEIIFSQFYGLSLKATLYSVLFICLNYLLCMYETMYIKCVNAKIHICAHTLTHTQSNV